MSSTAKAMNIDMHRMRLETGIPRAEIEAALQQSGPAPEDITSFEEAVQVWQKRYETPEEASVLRRMIELANTVENVVFAYNCTAAGSPERRIAVRKATTFFIKS